jgi:sugar phosphate isomerase/epimerase
MKKRRVLLFSGLLAVSAFAWGVQDQGQLSLAGRQEQRSKVFNDGRSLVAYRQSGTMLGGDANGPWKKAALYVQGTVYRDPGGTVVADAALWETTDPEGDLVWGVLWQPKDAPHALEIKAGTGKWQGISGKGKLLNKGSGWEIEWSIANLESAALRFKPGDYDYHDSGFSFHGPHVTETSRKLPNGAALIYNNQSGVLLSDDREARSPRNLATSYDRGTTYRMGDKDLADIMLLEDTDPDGDTVWLYHEWWYGKGPGSYEFIGGTGKWEGISGYGKTLGVLRDRADDHWLLKSEMHWDLPQAGPGSSGGAGSGATGAKISTPHALERGWRVSCQHYSLRDRGLYEAIDALAGMGISNIEPTDFLKLENGDETATDFRISPDKRAAWKKRLADRGMKMPSYYVSKKGDYTDRRLWDFMKDMGVEVVCGEPDPSSLEKVEGLCREYGIKLAIHNHPEGRSLYWNPVTAMDLIAAQGRLGPEIGFCPDVGHWARSCVDIVSGLSKYHERAIHVLHVKDVPRACEGWKNDLPLGDGVIPFLEIFDSLSAWKWQGIITVELEADPADLRDIDACAKSIEDHARTRIVSGVKAQEPSVDARNQKWTELIKTKRAELAKTIDKTFQIIIATDEDRLMASVLLWDDGRIEIHYRDYHPEDTSLKARAAVRIYQAISRSREDHKKVGTDEYVKRMMSEQAPNPDKIIDDAIRAIRHFED